jgi:hypothetical protein
MLEVDEAIDLGHEPPLSMGHLEAALPELHPTTAEWLASARNYVDFANQTGRYDEVAAYLRSKEAKRLSTAPAEPHAGDQARSAVEPATVRLSRATAVSYPTHPARAAPG